MTIDAWRIGNLSGFGMTASADSYIFKPSSSEDVHEAFKAAARAGRQVVLRGAGRSYGDASILPESVAIDISRMNRVHSWDPTTGLLVADSGLTLEGIWRNTIEDGYWPAVVSGTMFPTLAGALAMNIHGKNNYCEGTLGEHVEWIEVAHPNGTDLRISKTDPRFFQYISSAGLLGAITRVGIKLKKLQTGLLNVLPLSIADWDEQFHAFEANESTADYMVSWVDMFAKGKSMGRGEFHCASYAPEYQGSAATFLPSAQELPDSIFGLIPKSVVWRFLRPLNNRPGTRFINGAKYRARKLIGNGKVHPQSLVAFSFLLDFVPGWRNAYMPGGFIQYQCFVPKSRAREVFEHLTEMQHRAGQTAFLGVMKRHRPDNFLFSHAVDGYSIALDFKSTSKTNKTLIALCHDMNDVVLRAGGKFYLAKDSTLRPEDFHASVGGLAVDSYLLEKRASDPECLLTSSLAKRLRLDPSER